MKNYLTTGRMLILGAILGILFWLLDSAIDFFLIGKSSFLLQVFTPDPGELWMRLFVLSSFIGFGYYAGIIISRTKKAEEMARRDREFVETVINGMHDAISVIDARDFRIIDVNAAFLSDMGLTRDEVIGKTCHEVTHRSAVPCSAPGHPCPLCDTVKLGKYTTYEHIHYSSDGRKIHAEVSTNPVRDASGQVVSVIHVSRNIDARKTAETEMRKLSTAVEKAADMIVITDTRGIIEYVNPAFETVTGYSREEALGKTPRILKSGMHGDEFYRVLWETILSGNIYRDVFVNRKKNGELYYDECTITPMRNEQNEITNFIATAKVITERVLAENALREYAEKDSLTGALNRRKFYEELEQEKERAVRYLRPLSLIMFDIDHFKAVNDTYGHAAGDKVLKKTASVVAEHIRKADVFGRIGGEEFAVLATETTTESALALAEKIRSAVEMAEHDHAGQITISIGVSTYDDGLTPDEFVRRADEALYKAKNNGRNKVECYGTSR